jgi:hypothetical protein
MFSGPILAAVGPAMLAFFVGTAAFAIPLIRTGSRLGWAAAFILIGTFLISPRSSPRRSFSANSATFWPFAGAQQLGG